VFLVYDKLQPRGVPCLFLCSPQARKGYVLLNLLDHKRFVTRDVLFFEHIFPYHHSSSTQFQQPLPSVGPTIPTWNDDLLELSLLVSSSSPGVPVIPPVSCIVDSPMPLPSPPSIVPTAPLGRTTRAIKPLNWLQGFVTNSCKLQHSSPLVSFAMTTYVKPKF